MLRRAPSDTFKSTQRPADADHRRQPHRLRRAQQAGHQRRARRAAGRGGDPARQAELRLAGGRASSWCPTACASTSATGIGARGRRAARRLAGAARGVPQASIPELADQLYRMQRRELPDGWDKDLPTFPADRQGHGHAATSSGKVLNAVAKNVPWLIGGSADLAPSTKTRLTFDGAGDFSRDELRRPQLALRHPRARHGRDRERPGAVARCAPTARAS